MWLRLCGSTPVVGSSRNSHLGSRVPPAAGVQAAFHAAGKGAGPIVGPFREPHGRENAVDAASQRLAVHAVEAAEEFQVLAGRQIGVNRQVLRADADNPTEVAVGSREALPEE